MQVDFSKLKKVIGFFIFLMAIHLPSLNFAAHQQPLPANQAFIFSVSVKSPTEISANWQIAPGYYLYRQRFNFVTTPEIPIHALYPKPLIKFDPNKRSYEAYGGNLSIPLTIKAAQPLVQLKVDYQGCSEFGFCYPPIHKTVQINLATLAATIDNVNAVEKVTALPSLLTDQHGIQALLHTEHFALLLLLFAGLGLLLAFTPCVLPMIPILTSIIVGQKQPLNARKAFLLSLTYVVGAAVTYAFAGLAAAWMGNSLQMWLQQPWIIAATSSLFVLLALSLFGLYELRLPRILQNRLTHLSNQQKGGNYVGVFFMGILSSLIVSPCVTAPLVGVLMYIAQTGDLVLGASTLFAMGIGMGIPLLLIGMSAGKWLPKSGAWMEAVKKAFGILMLGMAIWLLSRIASQTIILFLSGILLLGVAIFFAMYLPRVMGRHALNRILGALVGISGMLVMISSISMPTKSFLHLQANNASSFIVIRNMSDLNKQLLIAQAAHQPVLLDFYADWCESCIAMDKNVFKLPDVQKNLLHYVLLRADLTENTSNDEVLLKHYSVIAPPTVVFFDKQGRELDASRIVGEVNAKEFLARLSALRSEKME